MRDANRGLREAAGRALRLLCLLLLSVCASGAVALGQARPDVPLEPDRSSVRSFGARGDAIRVAGCIVDPTGLVLECPRSTGWRGFAVEDVGKLLVFAEAGQSGPPHVTTIGPRLDDTRVVLAAPATDLLRQPSVALRSTTTNRVGPGQKVFMTDGEAPLRAGVTVRVGTASASTAFMYGRVISRQGQALKVDVFSFQGTGDFADWAIATLSSEIVYGSDDTAALQTAARAVSESGGKLIFPPGSYLITDTIRFARRDPAADLMLNGLQADRYDHPLDLRTIEVEAAGLAQVIAARPMGSMFHFTFGAAVDPRSAGPSLYGAELRRLSLNGMWLATSCLETSSMREMVISHNKFSWCRNGVFLNGVYGGNRLEYNVIMGCEACIRDTTGDQLLLHNSIAPYVPAPGSTAYGYYSEGGNQGGGNLVVSANTFETVVASHAGSTAIYPVFIDGRRRSTETFRDITVDRNEFQGATVGVTVLGNRSASRLAFNVRIADNHTVTHANGISNPGALANLSWIEGFVVRGNSVGDPHNLTAAPGLRIDHAVLGVVSANTFNRSRSPAIVAQGSDQLTIVGNAFRDVGSSATASPVILLEQAASRTLVTGNTAHRTSPTFAGRFLIEKLGEADYTSASANALTGLDEGYECHGQHSVCGR